MTEPIRLGEPIDMDVINERDEPFEISSPPRALSGASLIAVERSRQITEEGYSAESDDIYEDNQFVKAAITYLFHVCGWSVEVPFSLWPWRIDFWKPKDRKRNLVRAGALIAAELDRMIREEKEIADAAF